MALIETEEAARRLARAIASDLSLYNEEKILEGIQQRHPVLRALRGAGGGQGAVQEPRLARAVRQELLRPRGHRHPRAQQGSRSVQDVVAEPGVSPYRSHHRPGRAPDSASTASCLRGCRILTRHPTALDRRGARHHRRPSRAGEGQGARRQRRARRAWTAAHLGRAARGHPARYPVRGRAPDRAAQAGGPRGASRCRPRLGHPRERPPAPHRGGAGRRPAPAGRGASPRQGHQRRDGGHAHRGRARGHVGAVRPRTPSSACTRPSAWACPRCLSPTTP